MQEILKLKNKKGNYVNARIKILDASYIDKIMIFQDEITEGLEDKQLYAPSDKDEFLKCIESKGKVIGILDDNEDIIAIGVYIKKGYDKENYGYDLELKEEDLLKVSQIESTLVKDNFRGNRLQKIICEKLEEIAKEEKMKFITATASPYNKYSVNNFMNLGYEIKKDKLKYGGLRRYVLAKELY